jgi:class 3 adenylate cyclase
MSFDFSALSLTEMIRIREHLSEEITRKFERRVALAFSDVVGSTNYFARFGDRAGRALQQRHIDMLQEQLPATSGRIVDTAGDGAFLCFPTADQAIEALSALETKIVEFNSSRAPEHHLLVRIGIHFGPALTDGTVVTGDSVNLCARVTATAEASSIRVTKAAYMELASARRLRCKALPSVELKGIANPVEIFEFAWREPLSFPTTVLVEETGQVHKLPHDSTVTFGRLAEHDGKRANDIILTLPDEAQLARISRWHFELRRQPDGFYLRPVSEQTTEVDGVAVTRGGQVIIRPGSKVRLGGVMTLVFFSEQTATLSLATIMR